MNNNGQTLAPGFSEVDVLTTPGTLDAEVVASQLSNEVPKSALTILGLGVFIFIGMVVAKAVEWCYDRISVRDADSEMSERTKQLLLARISTFAFGKKVKIENMDPKQREAELSKKYMEKWRFRVAMNKRMRRRNEIVEKERQEEAKRKKGPFAALQRFFSRKKQTSDKSPPLSTLNSPVKSLPEEKKEPVERPKTANSASQTVKSILKKVPFISSPSKSSIKTVESSPRSPGSPNKTGKRVTLFMQPSRDSPRGANEEEFIAVEMTHHSTAGNSQAANSASSSKDTVIHVEDKQRLLQPQTYSGRNGSTEPDIVSNISSVDEFDFTPAASENYPGNNKNKQPTEHRKSPGNTPVASTHSMTPASRSDKYVRPPTREAPPPKSGVDRGDPPTRPKRPVTAGSSRPITAGGARSSAGRGGQGKPSAISGSRK